MKNILLFLIVPFLVIGGTIKSQNFNLALADQLTYGSLETAGCWGWKDPQDGKEYALVGVENGLSIVDVSNPTNIFQVVQIPGPVSQWREITTWGNYAYVATEGGSIGLQIVDLTNLPATNLTVTTWAPTIGTTTLKTIHALYADAGKVYLYGTNVGAVIADVSTTPTAPVYLGRYTAKYVHDGYVRNNILYAACVNNGECNIINVSNPASPVTLASFTTPHSVTHNTWLSADSKTLFTTDEANNSNVTAYNITNLSNITELDRINTGTGAIIHNVYVYQKNGIEYAFAASYKDGVFLFNVTNPSNMTIVGKYDTYPSGTGGGYAGCWGVYPYLPSGIILASDIQGGLFVFNPTYVVGVDESNFANTNVSVYPNPFSTSTTLSVQGSQSNVQGLEFAMYDVYGRAVKTLHLEPGTVDFKLERDNLASGIYFYQIMDGNTVIATGKMCAE